MSNFNVIVELAWHKLIADEQWHTLHMQMIWPRVNHNNENAWVFTHLPCRKFASAFAPTFVMWHHISHDVGTSYSDITCHIIGYFLIEMLQHFNQGLNSIRTSWDYWKGSAWTIALRLGRGTTLFRVASLAQLVRASVMYCWRLGALFQGPGFESHCGVLFISHPNSFW